MSQIDYTFESLSTNEINNLNYAITNIKQNNDYYWECQEKTQKVQMKIKFQKSYVNQIVINNRSNFSVTSTLFNLTNDGNILNQKSLEKQKLLTPGRKTFEVKQNEITFEYAELTFSPLDDQQISIYYLFLIGRPAIQQNIRPTQFSSQYKMSQNEFASLSEKKLLFSQRNTSPGVKQLNILPQTTPTQKALKPLPKDIGFSQYNQKTQEKPQQQNLSSNSKKGSLQKKDLLPIFEDTFDSEMLQVLEESKKLQKKEDSLQEKIPLIMIDNQEQIEEEEDGFQDMFDLNQDILSSVFLNDHEIKELTSASAGKDMFSLEMRQAFKPMRGIHIFVPDDVDKREQCIKKAVRLGAIHNEFLKQDTNLIISDTIQNYDISQVKSYCAFVKSETLLQSDDKNFNYKKCEMK